jgi:hypothetical protein
MVSYGLPNVRNETYDANRQIDLNKANKTYNGTLWQKIYVEEDEATNWADPITDIDVFFLGGANYGLAYMLVASITGYTPLFH